MLVPENTSSTQLNMITKYIDSVLLWKNSGEYLVFSCAAVEKLTLYNVDREGAVIVEKGFEI